MENNLKIEISKLSELVRNQKYAVESLDEIRATSAQMFDAVLNREPSRVEKIASQQRYKIEEIKRMKFQSIDWQMRENGNDQGDLLKGTYVGETLNNRPHGFGIFTYKELYPLEQ